MNAASPLPTRPSPRPAARLLAEQAFSRAAGAPLIGQNAVELLVDARANFDAWLGAIASARHQILFENYIFTDDAVAQQFRDALVERAAAGVRVCVVRDWVGCLGQSRNSFWQALRDAGGEVRTYNPPQLSAPFAWLSRDHRKSLVVDDAIGFLAGICVSAKWLGDARRGIAPWRDSGISLRGPALAEVVAAFASIWRRCGQPLPDDALSIADHCLAAGNVDLRIVATLPNTAGLYRLDQLIAAMAQRRLWLTDAYFVGITPYVQALAAAARDGVDVRLLVPGSSDIPSVGSLSRAGYRPLLEAGVRVFEWNGSMLHAKTAVADGRWARVGSSNLNVASWLGNCEIDVAIEDECLGQAMEAQYERDLANSTEIILSRRRVRKNVPSERRRHQVNTGSSSRATAGALRLANTVGAAITNRRVLGANESSLLLGSGLVLIALGVLAAIWPRIVAWPLALLVLWIGASLIGRYRTSRKRHDALPDD